MPAEATPLAIGAAHARRTFELLDSDGSGSLSLEELEQAVAALGVAPPCRKKLKAFFDHLDHDSNGRICFKEFEAFHAARLQELQRVYADMSSTAGVQAKHLFRLLSTPAHALSSGRASLSNPLTRNCFSLRHGQPGHLAPAFRHALGAGLMPTFTP